MKKQQLVYPFIISNFDVIEASNKDFITAIWSNLGGVGKTTPYDEIKSEGLRKKYRMKSGDSFEQIARMENLNQIYTAAIDNFKIFDR